MAYQPSWFILWQNHPERTIVVLFNPQVGDKGVHAISKVVIPKVNVIARREFEPFYYERGFLEVLYLKQWTAES